MTPLKNPSRVGQAVWEYWLMAREGFSPHAWEQNSSRSPRAIAAPRLSVVGWVSLSNSSPCGPYCAYSFAYRLAACGRSPVHLERQAGAQRHRTRGFVCVDAIILGPLSPHRAIELLELMLNPSPGTRLGKLRRFCNLRPALQFVTLGNRGTPISENRLEEHDCGWYSSRRYSDAASATETRARCG